MDPNKDFEKALKAAFEMPTDKSADPFSVDKSVKGTGTTHVLKRKAKDLDESVPSMVDNIPIEIVRPDPKKTKTSYKSAKSSNVDTSKQEKVYKMCVGYIEGFPEICDPPHHFDVSLPCDELQLILDGFQRRVQSHNELEMMRTGLITGAAVIENVFNFIPGQPIKLNGLADNFHASISRFDACLKEISIKYANSCSFTPEQLLLLIGLQVCIHTHETNTKRIVSKTVE
ncbi:MAG: hypothetical protein WB421_13495 [Terriglobales bacterium]